jgi:hypothetical protein
MTTVPTLLDAVATSLRIAASAFHEGVEEAPVAVLWTDPDGVWKPLVPELQRLVPELLVLGEYAPEKRSGPVIWLKCALARRIPAGAVPIFYLPGVSRHTLRNADQCPWDLQPLVELLYRGTIWTQRNGKDWTVEAFLGSEDGLGLDLAGDEATRLSLRSALSAVAKTPLEHLRGRGRRLEAADFDAVVVGDTARDLLTWIGTGDAIRKEWGEQRWFAFRKRCEDDFGFDPEKETPLFAAEKLGRMDSPRWQRLWERFRDSPALFGGVREALDRAQPTDQLILENAEPWPALNVRQEDELRTALVALEGRAPHEARQILSELESQHGARRSWVWARVGEALLATALDPLHRLAEATRVVPGSEKLADFVGWYLEAGWRADAAMLEAMQALKSSRDEAAIHATIRSVYAPWLDDVARKFQALAAKSGYTSPAGEEAAEGECLVFVDGLRFDTGQLLGDLLEGAGLKVERSSRLAAIPTVTSTAKPAVAPVAVKCTGQGVPPDFRPLGPDGNELTSDGFAKLLAACGYQRMREGESLAPANDTSRGWIETGRLDSRGHDLGAELAAFIPAELKRVVPLIEHLLGAGWKSVRIVTDHGWLLLPGGLPKHDLPGFLVESRWSRCAAIKGRSTPEVPTVPWRWNPVEAVAVAPGARAFKKGEAYAHGGLSPQECVTPVLRVTHGSDTSCRIVRIVEVRWKRLRCAVELDEGLPGLRADIRLAAADPTTSRVTAIKEIEADGQVSLLVGDEDLAGRPATVVILDSTGRVLAKRETQIGG